MKSTKKLLLPFFILTTIFIPDGCGENKAKVSKEYASEMEAWHAKRINNLKKERGWLNLVGLYWLNEGENTFGSDESNDIVFPENISARFMGKIIKKDTVITIIVNNGINVLLDEKPISKKEMKADVSGDPTVLNYQSLRWYIIKRGDKYGIRLRDLEAELVRNFEGIDRFPLDEEWKLNARFEKYSSPQKIMIPTIMGTIVENYSPGKLVFNIEDKEFNLSPTSAGKRLFIVFADLTSGEETYGAGRFLYVDGPDSNNNVVLDFNKAYNPPCVFTKYATCPLPTDDNKLRVRITAGEKNYGEGH